MAIRIGNYNFDGPHGQTSNIQPHSGVYVILGKTGGTSWSVVDVGESGNVRERIECHDRADCWKRHGHRELTAAVLYVAERDRMLIEREIRNSYTPPCGDR